MASYYWIKLYHEILDDPKMGRLPDHLWRRAIEMFLFAGRQQGNGEVPSVEDMAWSLRTTPAELQEDLDELERVGIIRQDDGADPFVVHFAQRQAPVTDAERKRYQRQRERHEQYTGTAQDGHEPVTNCDTELDKSRVDKEVELDQIATPAAMDEPAPSPALVAFENQYGPFQHDDDRDTIKGVVCQYGDPVVCSAIRWLKGKQSNNVIQAIVTASHRFATGPPPGNNGRGDRSSNATLQAIQELEAEVNGGFG